MKQLAFEVLSLADKPLGSKAMDIAQHLANAEEVYNIDAYISCLSVSDVIYNESSASLIFDWLLLSTCMSEFCVAPSLVLRFVVTGNS